jgi:hypothetical protein
MLSIPLVSATSAAGGAGGGGASAKPAAVAAAKGRITLQALVLDRLRKTINRRRPVRSKPWPKLPAPGNQVSPAPPSPADPQPQPQPQPGPLPVPPPGQSTVDRFGVSPDNIEFEEPAARDRLLDSFAAMGARWIRFDVKWEVIQNRGSASYDFDRYDELAQAARARGLKILGTLAYAPPWARSSACSSNFMCEPRDANEYATWAARTVDHFKGQISHWEIWNEPNISGFWKPQPNAAKYAALVKAAYPRIKAANPDAFVLAGATSPAPNDGTQIDEVTFMQQVYANGAQGSFDAWSHHPYTHPAPPGNVHPDSSWYQMYGASPNMRSVMAANGDGAKQLWGTEYGPPTSGTPGSVGEDGQARHVTDAYRLWRSYKWAGPLFWYSGRDLEAPGASGSAWNYMGLLRQDFTPKPAWYAYRAAVSG